VTKKGTPGPEQRTSVMHLSIYIKMRWLVVAGIIAIVLVALLAFNISFPTTPVFIVCGAIIVYNIFLFLWVRKLCHTQIRQAARGIRLLRYLQIGLDLAALTALLHFTGGVQNPFIFFFLVYVTAAGIWWNRKKAFGLTAIAVGLAVFVVMGEFTGVIPHVSLVNFVMPDMHDNPAWVSAVLTALAVFAFIATYISTSVNVALSERQGEVINLRDQAIQKGAQELKSISKDLATLEEEKQRFVRLLSTVSHDLQAPLVAVQSCISYVTDGYAGEITEGQRDWLQRGAHRIDALLTLITDLIDIPRIELGLLAREMKELSLNEVTSRAVEGLEMIARQKGLGFVTELPPVSPKVYGSYRRLQQVITNLTNNAISYTREGGITVRVRQDENGARVEFSDSGIGISSADLPRLFTEFSRGSNVETKGSGLGLSISKRIIEAHGGRVWAESPDPATGKGSRFTFTLPKNWRPK
jgi:signal transduction histidine kinase